MVKRHRTIPGPPVQSARMAWIQIADLISGTLALARALDQAEVTRDLDHLNTLGPMLVSAGHLERDPITLVATPLYLTVDTVSGELAFNVDERESSVTGAAAASDWELWLPEPATMTAWVRDAVSGHPRLKAGTPPDPQLAKAADPAAASIDMDAFRRAQDQIK